MTHKVFISYSTRDKAVADAVCAALEADAMGIRCWYAPRDVRAGADWNAEILDAISASRVMVLVWSANSSASKDVTLEVKHASRLGVTVIPLRIEDVALNKTLAYYLEFVHWMDATTPPVARHMPRLVEHVRESLRQPEMRAGAESARTTRREFIEQLPRSSAGGLLWGIGLLLLFGSLLAAYLLLGGSRTLPPTSPQTSDADVTRRAIPHTTPVPAAATPAPQQTVRVSMRLLELMASSYAPSESLSITLRTRDKVFRQFTNSRGFVTFNQVPCGGEFTVSFKARAPNEEPQYDVKRDLPCGRGDYDLGWYDSDGQQLPSSADELDGGCPRC